MGIIKIVTPKNAVLYDERIQKYITKPKASKVQVENLHDSRALTKKTINGTDFL